MSMTTNPPPLYFLSQPFEPPSNPKSLSLTHKLSLSPSLLHFLFSPSILSQLQQCTLGAKACTGALIISPQYWVSVCVWSVSGGGFASLCQDDGHYRSFVCTLCLSASPNCSDLFCALLNIESQGHACRELHISSPWMRWSTWHIIRQC